jgi:hypothetical protein
VQNTASSHLWPLGMQAQCHVETTVVEHWTRTRLQEARSMRKTLSPNLIDVHLKGGAATRSAHSRVLNQPTMRAMNSVTCWQPNAMGQGACDR